MSSTSESDWEISSISESDSDDTDTDTTDDESDAEISPVPSAFTGKTNNTTETVSSRHCITRDPLSHGSDEPLSGDLGSDGELADDEDEEDGSSDPESEVEDYHNTSQYADNNEEEEEDDTPKTPQWDPSTFVYVGELTFPEQWPLLPLPMNETNYPEEELADDEKDPQPKFSSVEGDEDVTEEIEDLKHDIEDLKEEIKAEGNTGVSPPASVPELVTPPDRLKEVEHLLGYRPQELARRKARCRGDVCNVAQDVRGKKRGSEDEDEDGERAQKVQRRF